MAAPASARPGPVSTTVPSDGVTVEEARHPVWERTTRSTRSGDVASPRRGFTVRRRAEAVRRGAEVWWGNHGGPGSGRSAVPGAAGCRVGPWRVVHSPFGSRRREDRGRRCWPRAWVGGPRPGLPTAVVTTSVGLLTRRGRRPGVGDRAPGGRHRLPGWRRWGRRRSTWCSGGSGGRRVGRRARPGAAGAGAGSAGGEAGMPAGGAVGRRGWCVPRRPVSGWMAWAGPALGDGEGGAGTRGRRGRSRVGAVGARRAAAAGARRRTGGRPRSSGPDPRRPAPVGSGNAVGGAGRAGGGGLGGFTGGSAVVGGGPPAGGGRGAGWGQGQRWVVRWWA